MLYLVAGLIVFFGLHSTRIVAEDARTRIIAARGEMVWKGVYSLLSLAGLALIVCGFSEARAAPIVLWHPPIWMRHVAALLTLPAFILLVAAYVPGNAIKARLAHPMVLGVKLWALAHLLANVLLFGSFLIWAAFSFRAARRRDRAAGTTYASAGAGRTVATLVVGAIAWWVFVRYLHAALIGVAPLG